MAKRNSAKFIQNLPSAFRSLNSSPSSIPVVSDLNFAETHKEPIVIQPRDLDFTDSEKLFSSVSTIQLLRSSVNLHAAAFDPFVNLGISVLNSRLLRTPIFREIILTSVKHTFYEHFCAGGNVEEATRTLQKIWNDGLRGILDYGLEDADDNESCDRNLEAFLGTVDTTTLLPPSSVSFSCVKITAICPISLLERVSDLLRWEQKDPSFNLPWKHNTLPVLCDSSPLYHTLKKPEPLTPQEEQDLHLAHQRLEKLCKKCEETNLPLLVDAEYTSVQPAIDYLTYSAAIMFNKEDDPLVFGTIQAYLKDAGERLVLASNAAGKIGIPVGFKLVRGAYMSRESRIASSLGFNSPIHGSIKETHACYDDCASFMIDKVSRGSGAVVLATHNLDSGKVAAKKAQSMGIPMGERRLQFAQLKGMAEALSYGLRNAGFQVSKYLPFGPIEKVMPYLVRRAEENRGLLSASSFDRHLISKELKRRLKVKML